MIFEIGDRITLTSTINVNDGSATLTVTNPLGVVATTTGIAFTSGAYTGTFLATAEGRHLVHWATANNATQDVFQVRGIVDGVISLDDARNWLRLRPTDNSDDEKIQALIETATDLIEDVTGPLSPQTYVEQFDGGGKAITVMHPPLISVTKVFEYFGTNGNQLTEQPLGGQTGPFAFTVDYTTGQLQRRTFGGQPSLFAQGAKNVIITYVGGASANGGAIPASIQMATRELVKHLYNNTQVPTGKARVATSDMESTTGASYAIPNFVLDMIPLKYRRPPGVA